VPQYQYKGRNRRGIVVKGFAEAESLEQLKVNLRKNAIWVTEAKTKSELWQKLTSNQQAKISNSELISFTKQMGVMLNSNVSLLRAMETCQDNVSKQFKPVLTKMIEEIKSGKTYTQTLTAFSRIFSPFYIGMIQIGETGGLWGEIHQKIVTYLEQGATMRGKVLFAAIYPCMVLGVTIIGVSFILIFGFPRIAEFYEKSNIQLPFITQALLKVSDFMVHYWILALIFLVTLTFLFLSFYQKAPVKGWLDKLVFKIPVYGNLLRQILLYRFTHNLALLLNSGVPLTKALEVIRTTITNQIMAGYIEALDLHIKKGGEMAEYLQQNRFFPPLLVSMVRTGEESGELAKMVNDTSKYYEAAVERGLNKLIALLEPVLIICAAGIVFIILLAFYLPMFKMFQAIH